MQATEKQLEYIRDLLAQAGEDEMALCLEYDVSTLEELTVEQASSAIDELKILLR